MDEARCALWDEVVDRLELEPSARSGRELVLEGRVQRFAVLLRWDPWGPGAPRITIELHVGAELRVHCLPADRAPSARWVETGDAGFDTAVRVLPSEPDPRPWLDPKTRALLVRACAEGVSSRGRRLVLEPEDADRLASADDAVRLVGELAELARRLRRRLELADLLERVADPADGVREAALGALQHRVVRLSTPTEVRRLCEAVPDGRDPLRVDLLVRAAQAGGPEPSRLIRHLAVVAPADPRVLQLVRTIDAPPAAIADAVLAMHAHEVDVRSVVRAHASDQGFAYELARRMTPDDDGGPLQGGAALLSLLDPRTPATQVAVIRALATWDRPEDDTRFAQHLAVGVLEARQEAAKALCAVAIRRLDRGDAPERLEGIVETARASSALLDALLDGIPDRHAHWLAELEPAREDRLLALVHRLSRLPADPKRPTDGLEALLVPLLEHPTDQVRFAAVDALGAVGSPAAVEPLRRRGSGFRAFGELKLQRAIEEAIERIQVRQRSAVGALSVATTDSGRLSEASAGGGALSAVEPDPDA